ncbi:MAG: hypothetical protein ACOC0A_04100 [Planctomycetota bacterium]
MIKNIEVKKLSGTQVQMSASRDEFENDQRLSDNAVVAWIALTGGKAPQERERMFMMQEDNAKQSSCWEWTKEYGIGIGLGGLLTIYGAVALLTGQAFLPSLQGDGLTVGGKSGLALAGAYLFGGVYLFLRLHLEGAVESQLHRSIVYALQCLLLAALIILLVYVLLHVGEVV